MSQRRIVGGVEALRGKWPWMAAVFRQGIGNAVCGGSIVSDRFILTAAHCCEDRGRMLVAPCFFLLSEYLKYLKNISLI